MNRPDFYKKSSRLLYLLVFLILIMPLSARVPFSKSALISEQGLPFIKNYSPDEYSAQGQNWSIVQDRNGFLYFANTDGCVLQYDGVSWRQIPVSNNSIVRSLAIDSSGTIFVGAQNEIGFLAADTIGMLRYHSLIDRIPEEFRDFGNIWQIHAIDSVLYFHSRKYLFRLSESEKVKVWPSSNVFHSSFLVDGEMFLHEMNTGLLHLEDDSIRLIPGGEKFADDHIYAVLPLYKNKLLIAARLGGLFTYNHLSMIPFADKSSAWLKANQVYKGIILPDSSYVFSTIRGGILHMSAKGEMLLALNKQHGLQDENIWDIYNDRDGALWLATNSGISRVDYPGFFSLFRKTNGLDGNVQKVLRHKDKIYAATSLGVYRLDIKNPVPPLHFKFLNTLKSQCWAMLAVENHLLVSSNFGVHEIIDDDINLICTKSSWTMIPSPLDSNRIFLGLDDGIAHLIHTPNGWVDEGRIPEFKAEARTLAFDKEGFLWVGTVYSGVYRVDLTGGISHPVIQRFTVADGLPSEQYNLVFNIDRDVLFGTTHGVYHYDNEILKFKKSVIEKNGIDLPGDTASYTLVSSDGDGGIWFNCSKKLYHAVRRPDLQNYMLQQMILNPFHQNPIYTIFPDKDHVVWFGGPKGLVRYDNQNNPAGKHISSAIIRSVRLGARRLLYAGDDPAKNTQKEWLYSNSVLRFEYALPFFENSAATQYRVSLDGFDHDVSEWTNETIKDYTNLPEGKYTFTVTAKNIYGGTSLPASFSFKIHPPWFRTFWAYALYLAAAFGFLILIMQIQVKHTRRKALEERIMIEKLEKAAEEKMQKQMAADFHDELGNRITRISLFSEILKNQFSGKHPGQLSYIEKINDNAYKLYNETRDFIWQLDPGKDSLADLTSRLKNFGDELFEAGNMQFEMKELPPDVAAIKLSMDQRRHTLRILQEAMHNALKYSGAKNVSLNVSSGQYKLNFTLCDDGKGFNPAGGSAGTGLKNMAARAQDIKAHLEIKSTKGTKVILTVNLP